MAFVLYSIHTLICVWVDIGSSGLLPDRPGAQRIPDGSTSHADAPWRCCGFPVSHDAGGSDLPAAHAYCGSDSHGGVMALLGLLQTSVFADYPLAHCRQRP